MELPITTSNSAVAAKEIIETRYAAEYTELTLSERIGVRKATARPISSLSLVFARVENGGVFEAK